MKKFTRKASEGINHRNESKFINRLTPTRVRIYFEDQGQDLLWWLIDFNTEQVVDCGPFHKQIYVGKYVFCPKSLRIGMHADYSDTPITQMHQPLTTIKYKIIALQELA